MRLTYLRKSERGVSMWTKSAGTGPSAASIFFCSSAFTPLCAIPIAFNQNSESKSKSTRIKNNTHTHTHTHREKERERERKREGERERQRERAVKRRRVV